MPSQTFAPESLTATPVALEMLAPDFPVASDDDGGNRRLSDFRGHPVVLSFQSVRWDPTGPDQIELFNRLMHRFFGPGEYLERISRDGLWCHLHYSDCDDELPVLAPLSPQGDVAGSYGVVGSNAVFVVGSDGLVRWRHICKTGESRPSAEVLHALAQLAPVFQARQRRGTITRRDCAATMLAASAVLAIHPGRM